MNNEKNVKTMTILGCVGIGIVILLALVVKVFTGGFNTKVYTAKDIAKKIDDRETFVIYIQHSDSNKCENCKKVKRYLDSKKVSYINYDVKKSSDKDYDELLKKVGIDKDVFGYPAIIYIKKGMMYANTMNITDLDAVKTFIKNNDLKKK